MIDSTQTPSVASTAAPATDTSPSLLTEVEIEVVKRLALQLLSSNAAGITEIATFILKHMFKFASPEAALASVTSALSKTQTYIDDAVSVIAPVVEAATASTAAPVVDATDDAVNENTSVQAAND